MEKRSSQETDQVSKKSGRKILNRDFQKMSHSRMVFSGLGNLVLLIICFWIHWSLGVLFMIFWLFILPYLDMRRLRRYEAENPTELPSKESFDDSPFIADEDSAGVEDNSWKTWDDWDNWKEEKEEKEEKEDPASKQVIDEKKKG